MKVASPDAQQSWMFGQRASSQTVWSLLSLTAVLVELKMACCSPFGRRVLNHAGNLRWRLGAVSESLIFTAMGSGFPAIHLPPLV
jgi:hypothetical protein